jgi:3-oxoadipate enol-lactonase
MPSATANGIRLYYEVAGSGPPVLFIHGGFGGIGSTINPHTHDWATVLTDAYTFIHYDRRAAGRSEYPETGYDLATFAADAWGLLDHLGVQSAFVMGDSAGGPIALTAALDQPQRTRGLILAETGARLLRGTFADRLRARIEMLDRQGPEAAYDTRRQDGGVGLQERTQWYTLPPDVTERLMQGQRAAVDRLKRTTREERVRWYAGELRTYSAYMNADLHPRLNDIQCPTLVIHGDRDGLVPHRLGAALADGIHGAELVTIPDADHGVMYFPGAPEAVRRWLDRTMDSAPFMATETRR